jgi:choline dehydrogenase-like flavoprotein
MIIDDQQYDVIIIGTGAGGGTLARKLAPTGKQILVLERGTFAERESSELVGTEVFKQAQFHAPEDWFDDTGEPFSPQTRYCVGGNTKIWNGVLSRMRERDFAAVRYQDGLSPAWPLSYSDFEPYYTAAEQLYQVHGPSAADPTEPDHSQPYPFPAVAHEEPLPAIADTLKQQGLHPSHLPLGLGDQGRTDAEDTGVTPALKEENVTLKTGAEAIALHTNLSGSAIKAVEARVNQQSYLFLGDIVVVSCGAVNSAALLLQSANDAHPKGIANGSDQVGRNLMKQLLTVVVQLTAAAHSGFFPRTVGLNDYYWGNSDFSYPMGHVQNSGGILQDVIFSEAPPILSALARALPNFGLRQLATRSLGWWLQTADLPNPNNRARFVGSKLRIEYQPNNVESHDRLVYHWTEVLKQVEAAHPRRFSRSTYPRSDMPIQVMAHQCGTCRFGENPTTSVLDLNCRAHEVDNLYVVDSSFFPANASVSPGLTVIANALRVGDHLIQRL